MSPRLGSPPRAAADHRVAISGVDASTFSAGIRLLPDELRHDIPELYRMLRTIDDLVDERDPEARPRLRSIEHWAHGQQTESPEVRILNDLSHRYELPRDAIAEFCAGMRHDLAQ